MERGRAERKRDEMRSYLLSSVGDIIECTIELPLSK